MKYQPALETLERPAFSSLRTTGMIALRGYLAVAVVLVAIALAILKLRRGSMAAAA